METCTAVPLTDLYRRVLVFSSVIFTCQGILFDLDGVLVDSTAAVARVWGRWAAQHRLDPERVIREAHGRRSIESVRTLAPHLDAERENRIVEAMEIDDQDGVVALPGATQLLRELPAGKFSIVTSATWPLAVARLRHAGVPVPGAFISAGDVREGKPSPQPYLEGARLLGLAPRDCVVFEDAPAGIESARHAGMGVIALTTTFPAQELSAADAIVSSLAAVRTEVGQSTIHIDLAGDGLHGSGASFV